MIFTNLHQHLVSVELKQIDHWVVVGFGAGMEALGWTLIP